MDRLAITLRLTRNAGSDTEKNTAAPFRDFVAALQAMGLPVASWNACPCPLDPVGKRPAFP